MDDTNLSQTFVLNPGLIWRTNDEGIQIWAPDGKCLELRIDDGGTLISALFNQLENGLSTDEIFNQFENAHEEIFATIEQLERRGLIVTKNQANGPMQGDEIWKYERTFGSTWRGGDIGMSTVTLLGNGVIASMTQKLLGEMGINSAGCDTVEEAFESADLVLVLPDVVDRTLMKQVNELALKLKIPWLPVTHVSRAFIAIGPFFNPVEDTPCYDCFNHRRQANWLITQQQQQSFEDHVEQNGKVLSLTDLPTCFQQLTVSMIGAEVFKFIAEDWPRMHSYEQLLVLDLDSYSVNSHPVIKLPACPSCRPAYQPRERIWFN